VAGIDESTDRVEESKQGYPEEAPPGADPAGGSERPSEDSSPRQSGKARRKHREAEPGDDGKATGNPRSAG
jgi:hypothetical protein